MPTKKKIYPMLEKIDLANVPQDVLSKLFDFLNGATTALAIAEATARYADFIQGVTTGEKVAASILLARDKAGGKFSKLAELQAVAYFTEDKLKTLVAVFYVEAGVWQLPAPVKQAPVIEDTSSKVLNPEPVPMVIEDTPVIMPSMDQRLIEGQANVLDVQQVRPLPEVEAKQENSITLDPILIRALDPTPVDAPISIPTNEIPPSMPEINSKGDPTAGDPTSGDPTSGDPVKDGGSGLIGGKQVTLDLTLVGRLVHATPKVSFKGYANELAYLSAAPLGNGTWRLVFKTNFTAGTPSVPLRLDFEESGIHVLAVMATWNPLKPAPLFVRL